MNETWEQILNNNGLLADNEVVVGAESVTVPEVTPGIPNGVIPPHTHPFKMPDNITIRQPEILGGFIRNSEIDIKNTKGQNIFNVKRSGADIGDVTIGNYSGEQGILYDYSADTTTFKGSLEAGSIHIPDQTTADSFHTETDGDSYWGCNVADWASDNDNANAYILKTGRGVFSDIESRGLIRTAVFQKDVISSVGGNLMVLNSDVLDVDMTALDASTLTTKATTTFSVGDFLRIKDGTDDEWFEITAVNGAVYTVTRDKDSDYAADTNPTWKKGATVVNYGQSGDGGIFMTASETNAPYLSVFTHAGIPWTSLTTRLRIGNLNGYLGYTTDLYGIGIGDATHYLKYDPTNHLRISGEITGGSISIGSGSPAPFVVDSSGNAQVKSLERNDFHWFTTFESVDGYSKITDGTGTITATLDGAEVKTGNVTDNDTEIKKALGDEISFDKDSKFKCEVKITDSTYQRIEIGIGTIGTYPSVSKHFSFLINGSTLYAIMADGTTSNETELQEISAGGTYLLEAKLDASTGFVKFYVDGSLSHTSDDSITPTGAGNYSFIVRARTKENAVKEAIVKWWDFWQAI